MFMDYHSRYEKQYLKDSPLIEPFFFDIDKEVAARAFYNTSHHPESRGASLRATHSFSLQSDKQSVIDAVKLAHERGAEVLDSHYIIIDNWFIDHRKKLKQKYLDYIDAHSNVASSFICGPTNLPVERNRKKGLAADRKSEDTENYRKSAVKHILKVLFPFGDGTSINSSDPKAKEKLIV